MRLWQGLSEIYEFLPDLRMIKFLYCSDFMFIDFYVLICIVSKDSVLRVMMM